MTKSGPALAEISSRSVLDYAWCLEKEGHREQARELLRSATSLGYVTQELFASPMHSMLAHFQLAKLYEADGMKAEAIAQYEFFVSHWQAAVAAVPEVAEAQAALRRLR